MSGVGCGGGSPSSVPGLVCGSPAGACFRRPWAGGPARTSQPGREVGLPPQRGAGGAEHPRLVRPGGRKQREQRRVVSPWQCGCCFSRWEEFLCFFRPALAQGSVSPEPERNKKQPQSRGDKGTCEGRWATLNSLGRGQKPRTPVSPLTQGGGKHLLRGGIFDPVGPWHGGEAGRSRIRMKARLPREGRRDGRTDGGEELGLFFPPPWRGAAGRGALRNAGWCFQTGI